MSGEVGGCGVRGFVVYIGGGLIVGFGLLGGRGEGWEALDNFVQGMNWVYGYICRLEGADSIN